MDAKYIAEIKAREQAATPGPWKIEDLKNRIEIHDSHTWGERLSPFAKVEPDEYANAAFIAHSRTDIPALVEVVEEANKACETACASAREYCDKLVIAEKQISTLKKALELACEDQTEHCPYTLHGGKRVCSKYPMYGLRCQDCAPKYYIQQAQEQEGKK